MHLQSFLCREIETISPRIQNSRKNIAPCHYETNDKSTDVVRDCNYLAGGKWKIRVYIYFPIKKKKIKSVFLRGRREKSDKN